MHIKNTQSKILRIKRLTDYNQTLQMVKLDERDHRLHCGVSGMPFPRFSLPLFLLLTLLIFLNLLPLPTLTLLLLLTLTLLLTLNLLYLLLLSVTWRAKGQNIRHSPEPSEVSFIMFVLCIYSEVKGNKTN